MVQAVQRGVGNHVRHIAVPCGRLLAARLPVIRRYLELAGQHIDTAKLLFRIKNHVSRCLAGLPGAAAVRQEIMACPDIAALEELLRGLS